MMNNNSANNKWMKVISVSQDSLPSRSGLHVYHAESRKSQLNLNLEKEIQALLGKLGSNVVEPVAYDTAWVARLGQLDSQLSAQAFDWLRQYQLADGSWGASQPLYHHDRVICTLAAIISFARNGTSEDRPRIEAALPALNDSLSRLDQDLIGKTIAFEMLLPTMIAEARSLGLSVHDPHGLVRSMAHARSAKLTRSPKGLISRGTTLGFSAEMVGLEGLHMLDSDDLQLDDGSLSGSPAATAFYAMAVRPEAVALDYLRQVAPNGAAPAITAIDNFERAWGLWNLEHAGAIDETTSPHAHLLLDALASDWRPAYGIPPASSFSVSDGDDTGLVYEVLAKFNRAPDLDAIWRYEEDSHFRCYDLENDPSISTNIHILGALRQIGLSATHPAIHKIATFLSREHNMGGFWKDKWHASPYYPTSHAIMVCAGYLNSLVEGAVAWMLASQNADGSWGYYVPTAEETAYCLQALMTWHQSGLRVPRQALARGAGWLAEHAQPTYPPLWIGKCLYCPALVVQSAILGALYQYECEFGALP
jgi:halimadienyl-diphosphate synthase